MEPFFWENFYGTWSERSSVARPILRVEFILRLLILWLLMLFSMIDFVVILEIFYWMMLFFYDLFFYCWLVLILLGVMPIVLSSSDFLLISLLLLFWWYFLIYLWILRLPFLRNYGYPFLLNHDSLLFFNNHNYTLG